MTTEKAQVRPNVPTAHIIVDERLIEMQVGETRELKATAIPLLASEQKRLSQNDAEVAAILSMLVTDKIQWTSSDAETATVDESGNVSALKEGTCKITVKSGEHEIVFNILVNVPIPEWASEEFLAYIERIGAYTELPLGTDGSAGPTAQYVTFGFERSYDDFRCLVEVDERTKTSYKGYDYAKGDDEEWYFSWCFSCTDTSHDHSLSTIEPCTNRYGETVYPAPAAYKITPRKWRLLDKEKGLMVMESYDNMDNLYYHRKTFSLFDYCTYNDGHHYAYYNKNDIEKIPYICNYETSYLHAWLDGGEYLECFSFSFMKKDGSDFDYDDNGYYKYDHTEYAIFRMNEKSGWYDYEGRYHDHYTRTNTNNPFQDFFAPSQLAQIKNENMLDCGEGEVNVKGRLFILGLDEIIKYYYLSRTPIQDPNEGYYVYDGKTFWTRTRVKGSDGKTKLMVVKTNSDGTVKEFIQLDGYDTSRNYYYIPAICVKPAPQE